MGAHAMSLSDSGQVDDHELARIEEELERHKQEGNRPTLWAHARIFEDGIERETFHETPLGERNGQFIAAEKTLAVGGKGDQCR